MRLLGVGDEELGLVGVLAGVGHCDEASVVELGGAGGVVRRRRSRRCMGDDGVP